MTRDTVPPMTRRERRAQERLDRPTSGRRRPDRRAPRPAWQSPVVLVSVTAVLIGIVVILFARPAEPNGGTSLFPPTNNYAGAVVDGEVLGAASAPVVMQLYSDFQCPACKLFVTAQLGRLVTDFVRPGTLRIEARDIAFLGSTTPDESLELAAGAACAAEQNRYWQFHDYVFWNQGRENRGDHDAEFLGRVADAAGLDRQAWDACFARNDVRPKITAQTSAAFAAGVGSTPTLVVNGQSIVGVPKTYDQLAILIQQLAAEASAGPSASPAQSAPPATGPTPS